MAIWELRFDTVGLLFVGCRQRYVTITALKANIREALSEIQLHTIDNVLKNCTDRVGYCMTSRGKKWVFSGPIYTNI